MYTRTALFLLLLFGLVLGAGAPVAAEDEAPPSPAAVEDDQYSAEELLDMVGPIALYPDIVISSVLPASTVPLDIVQAVRWLDKQEGEIDGPPDDSGWDGSVEALLQFPDVLTWMNENLDWTQELGYAVTVQQEEVLAAIQDFRNQTKEAGNLETNDKQEIVVTNENVIEIQPASPEVVYIPTYQPTQVVYAGSPPNYFWRGVAAGVVGAWAWNTIRWGGGRGHWGGGSINVNRNPTFNFNNNGNINRGNIGSGNRWNGNRNNVAAGRPANRAGGRRTSRPSQPNRNRPANRAKPGRGGVKPGKARPGNSRPGSSRPGSSRPGGSRPGGSRPGARGPSKAPSVGGSRPAAGNRSGGSSRPGAANRSGSGNRSGAGNRAGSGRKPSASQRPSSSSRGSASAFGGSKKSGSSARSASSRGRSSQARSSSRGGSRAGASRGGGGRSGGSRGGGGRGGGGRRR